MAVFSANPGSTPTPSVVSVFVSSAHPHVSSVDWFAAAAAAAATRLSAYPAILCAIFDSRRYLVSANTFTLSAPTPNRKSFRHLISLPLLVRAPLLLPVTPTLRAL